jgi:hypothetical protein
VGLASHHHKVHLVQVCSDLWVGGGAAVAADGELPKAALSKFVVRSRATFTGLDPTLLKSAMWLLSFG